MTLNKQVPVARCASVGHHARMANGRFSAYWVKARKRGLDADGCLLVVDVSRQHMVLVENQHVTARYAVSTARRGMGSVAGSFQTPPGLHEIAGRFGAGAAAGSVFVSRRWTGRIIPRARWAGPSDQDLILSRILRLRGLEPGVNRGRGVDSYRRLIYIHGTNHEDLLGRPASHGCVRMGNTDIVELFDLVRGRVVWCWMVERVGRPRADRASRRRRTPSIRD